VEASGKLNMAHEFDDEDGPVIFKRSSVSKSTQLHSETKKSTSHSHDGRSFKKSPDVPSANGQISSSQNGKVVSTAKASAVESSVGISKASTSTNLKTYVRSPSGSSKFASLGNKKESLIEKKIPVHVHVKEENNSSKHGKEESCEDSGDEMDNIPLSARLKMKNDSAKKTTPVVVKKSHEDSDDDLPLSARRLPNNNNLGKSSNNNGGSDHKKPLSNVQKGQQHGSNVGIKQERPSTLPVKRPLDKTDSLYSSVKKSKLSDPAPSINAKQISVKSESKVAEEDGDDDDDDVPLSQRMNKHATSVSKSSSVKKLTSVTKVNKAAAPSFKKKANFKKPGNKSEQFKSTKEPPSSGDGQKKWTTLVHNGIIFPPPYKPHGVKMLYKGKPVTLTPEQEEVGFCLLQMFSLFYFSKFLFFVKLRCQFFFMRVLVLKVIFSEL